MSIYERANKLIEAQNKLNIETFKRNDWVKLGRPWHRAIWLKSAELLEKYGWDWWTPRCPIFDRPQVILELVDILHFGISDLIQGCGDENISIERLLNSESHGQVTTPAEAIESFALTTLRYKRFDNYGYSYLIKCLDIRFSEIYTLYFSKNVLNLFRQENGYKEGTYIKAWAGGKEDNWHLARIVSKLNEIPEEDFEHELRSHLGREYRAINELD